MNNEHGRFQLVGTLNSSAFALKSFIIVNFVAGNQLYFINILAGSPPTPGLPAACLAISLHLHVVSRNLQCFRQVWMVRPADLQQITHEPLLYSNQQIQKDFISRR